MKHPDDLTHYEPVIVAALNEQIRAGEDSPGMDDMRPLTASERRRAETAIASILLRMDGEGSYRQVWAELARMARGEWQ